MNRREFTYRMPERATHPRPGSHRSRQLGEGQTFRHLVPLLSHPDPRRLDLRASLTDPFGSFQVRRYEQRSRLEVYALLDLSASMGYQGMHPKMPVMADFLAGLAASVYRHGDTLGVLGAAEKLAPEFFLPPTRQPGPVFHMTQRLRRHTPHGTHSRGLKQVWRMLPRRRCLVFLVSDCHLPLTLLREILTGLAQHALVPVVIWDDSEALPTGRGLLRLSDLEGGGNQLLALRPALRSRLEDNIRLRRERLTALFLHAGREPLFLTDGFNADQITRYFLETACSA